MACTSIARTEISCYSAGAIDCILQEGCPELNTLHVPSEPTEHHNRDRIWHVAANVARRLSMGHCPGGEGGLARQREPLLGPVSTETDPSAR